VPASIKGAAMDWTELWAFLTTHWKAITAVAAPIGAFIAVLIGAYVTNRGWTVVHNNNSQLERDKNQNAVNLEKRKAELNFVSDQIRLLYGPLTVLCETRKAAFNAMMDGRERKISSDGVRHFFDGSKLAADELRQWRLWRTEVLTPLVVQMETAILANGHLIEGTKMPPSFLLLMAHVASYKAVIKNWEYIVQNDKDAGTLMIDEQVEGSDGDYDPRVPHTGVINFPEEFRTDVAAAYQRLKIKQADLIRITQHVAFAERPEPSIR
jgi:hypothetical protein